MGKKQIVGVIVSCSLLCLIFSSLLLRAQHPLTPNPDFASALWVIKADGINKIATTDGSTLLQIADVKNIRAVTLDEQRGVTLGLYPEHALGLSF